MHLTSKPEAVEFVPGSYLEVIRLEELFSRAAPVEIDAGCGDGAFLAAMAARFPQRNFLGIERLLGRVRMACRRAARIGQGNVRVLRVEIGYAVQYLIPPGSVSVCHILFPDPWPKRRHWVRRLIHAGFLREVARMLAEGGELRLKTDDASYFSAMERAAAETKELARVEWEEGDEPMTRFERGFREKGLPVYRMLLRKV